MTRLVPALCAVCALGIGASAWVLLGARADENVAVPTTSGVAVATAGPRAALQTARRRCELPALDAIVRDLTTAATTPERAQDREHWRLVAEAHLERALLRSHRRGLRVGEPTYPTLPKELDTDVRDGLAAVARARQLGDDSAALFRIEAGLMSQRITGITTALQWNGRIHDALLRAAERSQDDPELHVALGLRKLLAPKLFGHDAQKALEHFEFAAKALAGDERPALFAAMACYLQQKRQQAITWLEQAVARNPSHTFARAVLRRLRAGEDDPFGRDVTDAEAAAATASK